MPTLPMRSTTSTHNTSAANQTYSASVPLSVYRELAAELQAVEAMLNSLDAQNQQLARQNQQLRQEIEKAVQSVFYLKQVADSAGAASSNYARTSNFRSHPSRPVAGSSRPMHRSRPPSGVQSAANGSFSSRETGSGFSEKVFTEEQSHYRRRPQLDTASQISGWRLAIAILLIMVTAFSAGYLLVRPLMQNRWAAIFGRSEC